MKVILLEDHKDLGKKGTVANVADGFARNFLIPRGIVVEATPAAMRELQGQKDRERAREKKLRAQAEKIKSVILDKTVVVKVKAGESGRLFGSVTPKDVAAAIKAQYKQTVDRRRIDMNEHMKTIGLYEATVKLFKDVEAGINIKVEAEGDPR